MSLSKLIEEVFQQGVELGISGDQLHYCDPFGKMTPALTTRLDYYHTKILSALSRHKGESLSFYPLSAAQKTLWFLYQVYGDIDLVALRRAFQSLIDRHASLRTIYTTLGH